jgi:hypothetical protein
MITAEAETATATATTLPAPNASPTLVRVNVLQTLLRGTSFWLTAISNPGTCGYRNGDSR